MSHALLFSGWDALVLAPVLARMSGPWDWAQDGRRATVAGRAVMGK